MPTLNHEAVAGGLAGARDVLGDEVSVRQLIISRKLVKERKLALADAKGIRAAGTNQYGLGMMQPMGRPQTEQTREMSPGTVAEEVLG